MSCNTNTAVSILNTEIKNKGFIILDSMFKEHGWHRVKNEMTWLCYTKLGHETDIFDIQITQSTIRVSIPIKGSPLQYVTSFKEYFLATEYIEARFNDFISM